MGATKPHKNRVDGGGVGDGGDGVQSLGVNGHRKTSKQTGSAGDAHVTLCVKHSHPRETNC